MSMFYIRTPRTVLARAQEAYRQAALVPGGTPAQAVRRGRRVGRGPVTLCPTLSATAAEYSRVRRGLTLRAEVA